MDTLANQWLGLFPLIARISQPNLRVAANGKHILLAVYAIAEPPQLGAARTHLQIQAATVGQLERFLGRLGVADLGICQGHICGYPNLDTRNDTRIIRRCQRTAWMIKDVKLLVLLAFTNTHRLLRTFKEADADYRSSAACWL